MGFLDRLLGKTPPAPEDPRDRAAREMLQTYLRDDGAEPILSASRDEQVAVAVATMEDSIEVVAATKRQSYPDTYAHSSLLDRLLRRKLPWDEALLVRAVDCVYAGGHSYAVSPAMVIGIVERFVAAHGVGPELRASVRRLVRRLCALPYDGKEFERWTKRLRLVLEPPVAASSRVRACDAWTAALVAQLRAAEPGVRERTTELLQHCETAKAAKPTKKFTNRAEELLEAVTVPSFAAFAVPLFDAVGTAAPPDVKMGDRVPPTGGAAQPARSLLDEDHTDMLRGLVWSCVHAGGHDHLVRALGGAAQRCLTKVPGFGPRNIKVGNACMTVLGRIASKESVAQLARLEQKVRHPSLRQRLRKELEQAAERVGISRQQLSERSVPTFGMIEPGLLRVPFGDFEAQLHVVGSNQTELTWVSQGPKASKRQKTVPKAVKESLPDELKSLRATAKELRGLLPAIKARLERACMDQRSWTPDEFREHFLEHPLVATLARRLIWQLEREGHREPALFVDGAWSAASADALDWADQATAVHPWHPIESDTHTVLAWRRRLEALGITQPFKQAHREIYVVTDAERQTDIYSNRFAAHVLKQHQFRALCQERGWHYTLQGAFDSHDTPLLELPQWGMRVEFWVEAPWDGGETSESGIFLTLSTDQVRFYRTGQNAAQMSVADVPPLVFTEVMRDVDLFVGVCSIGNDPTWSDGGPEGHFGLYWQSYSFGELSALAVTRREVLESLVPKLAIADRCRLEGRFLQVRGNLRSYKIHLGSTNILMEPNDQYLCIVSDRRSGRVAGNIYLPFEGDTGLSMILSKAFLLASDHKIQDRTIRTQIGT